MEEMFDEFLMNPNGEKYDILIATLNYEGAIRVFSLLDDGERHDLIAAAENTFGNLPVFITWLWTNLQSEDAKPIDLIKQGKLEEVFQILGRIRHGYTASTF